MSDPTLFSEQAPESTPAATVPDTAPVASANNGYDTMLQGITTPEGRQKYANLSDALSSILPKEQHISTLESENSVLREELATWKARLQATEALGLQTSTPQGNPQTENTSAGIDVNAIIQQVQAGISAQEQQTLYTQRVNNLKTMLVDKFGDKAGTVYNTRLAAAGISEQTLLEAETQSPGTAWKFLGLDTETAPQSNSIPTSTFNSTSVQNKQPEPRKHFRPTGQIKPGERLAAQRAETIKRLQDSGTL